MNLNMGCGELALGDCVNADKRRTGITDVLVDFEKPPFPFRDGSFDTIFAIDVIEHLGDVYGVIDELHRVGKPDCSLVVRTTFWKSENAFTSFDHKHFCTQRSFDYLDPSTEFGKKYGFYTDRKWKIIERRLDGQELVFILKRLDADTEKGA